MLLNFGWFIAMVSITFTDVAGHLFLSNLDPSPIQLLVRTGSLSINKQGAQCLTLGEITQVSVQGYQQVALLRDKQIALFEGQTGCSF